jgi:NAD(P)-dependent dehydrogenase (short-subunit alcohol dehydrogenase family)
VNHFKKALLIGSGATGAAIGLAAIRAWRKVNLRGQVVLITGGSRGLGLALAREFAARGAHLALCARNPEQLEDAKRDLESRHARVAVFPCDVGDRMQVEEFLRQAMKEFGRIDILVNNAGAITVGPIHTMTIEDFESAMNVMFWGTVYTSLGVLPHFRTQGRGCIVNITSVGGKVSVPHLVPYSCAKFAAVAFSEGLAAELSGTGIRVVTIAPGLMRTGSYVNALFKGNRRGEAAWFSASASLPGISMSAKRAAQQIVGAVRSGRNERILSLSANWLARFHGLFPEISLAMLSGANRLLPSGSESAPHQVETGAESEILERPWMRAITALGRRAAEEYLQPATR